MTRLSLTPINDWKKQTISQINDHFNILAFANAQREQAWLRKRNAATSDDHSSLEKEATERGLSVSDFVELILSKPDVNALIDGREYDRQTALIALDKARSPSECAEIVANLKA